MVTGTLRGGRRDHCSETLRNAVQRDDKQDDAGVDGGTVYVDAKKDVLNARMNTVCQGAVSEGRGCVDVTQVFNDTYKPGTHQGNRGGDEVCNGRVFESGNGDEGCSEITSLKTKPSEVGGGLKAKISLWAMKIGGILDEKMVRKHTRSAADGDSSCSDSTDRK